MKKIVLAILFVFCFLRNSAQQRILFNDASSLQSTLDANTGKFTIAGNEALLGYYFGTTLTNAQIAAKIQANPFLNHYFTPPPVNAQNSNNTISLTPGVASISTTGQSGGQLPGVGDFPITTIADGFAKFLVQRTKEELSVAFFVQIKQDFDDTTFIAIQTLLPKTKLQLDAIGDKIYQFSSYLTELRNAFNSDLEDLDVTFPYILNIPKYKKYFINHPWLEPVIEIGLFLSSDLNSQSSTPSSNNTTINKGSFKNVGNVIDDLNARVDNYFPAGANSTNANINGIVKTFGLISSSLRSSDASRYWVTNRDILKLLSDPVEFQIYLGLIYQSSITKKITFGGTSLKSILDDIAADAKKIQAVNDYISILSTQINLFDEDYKNLKNNNSANLSDAEKAAQNDALFTNASNIIQIGLSFLKDVNDNLTSKKYPGLSIPTNFFDNVGDYTVGLQDIINLYFNVKERKYSLAISSATDFFNVALKDLNDKNLINIIQKFNTYGTFIAQVANAKNSNQVDSLITATVLPTGSSYIKKHSIFNIALQAYTGFYGGIQQTATDPGRVGVVGVYAPVGLAFSWGGKKSILNPGAFSVFVSIIDLGPLVSYRFKNTNDTLANNINIRLSQIISPGLHLVWGIPKVPLSLGGGFCYIPLLTQVETNSIKVNKVDNSPFRAQIFLAVDIPLLNFHNKPR